MDASHINCGTCLYQQAKPQIKWHPTANAKTFVFIQAFIRFYGQDVYDRK